jgi:hypothetical protein
MVFIIGGLRIFIAYSDYKKSKYEIISGNKFNATFYNKGNYGEYLTFRILEKLGEENILTNIYLPVKNNETTEIDLLAVNEKGIFVFESKNYSGWIFGDEKSKMWTQTLQNKQKFKLYNPIWQNKAHISAINNYLNESYSNSFYSFIIFSERCELKKVNYTPHALSVIKRNQLIYEYKRCLETMPRKLMQYDIQLIYNLLKERTLANDETKKKHIKNVNAKQNYIS